MTPDEVFRHDILADPDDDGVRLIYADWLEENGDPERAEFIRAQCRLAGMEDISAEQIDLEDRARQLRVHHGERWLAEAPLVHHAWFDFGRGFLEKLTGSIPVWRSSIDQVVAAAPVREAEIHGAEVYGDSGTLDEWRDLPHVKQIRKLRFCTFDGERVATFLRHNDLRRLVSLDLGWTPTDTALVDSLLAPGAFPELTALRWGSGSALTLVERLADTAELPRLRELDLRGANLNQGGWWRLAGGSLLPRLTRLVLNRADLTDDRLKSLLDCPRRAPLRLLAVACPRLTSAAAKLLAGCEHLADLRSLDLSGTKARQRGLVALARSGRLANLRELRLNGSHFDYKSIRELAAAPHLGNLVSLSLDRCGLADDRLKALAESGCFPQLRQLSLEDNRGLTSAGIQALAGAPQRTSLRWLLLQGTPVDSEGVCALAASPHLRLTYLRLPARPLTEAAITALTESPVFRGLHTLQVQARTTPVTVYRRLHEHFGNAVQSISG